VGYIPLTNYKYASGPHQLQSGPNHEAFLVVSSGIVDIGADLGRIAPGVPNSGLWYVTDDFREVPPAVSGYWIDYTPGVAYQPSGALSAEEGYRPVGFSTIAYAKVQTSFSSNFGVRKTLPYTYFGGVAPDNQDYTPYDTPTANEPYRYDPDAGKFVGQGITGGGVTHGRYEGGLLTNPFGTSGSGIVTRADWTYNPPVYCRTYTEATRAQVPGLMSAVIRTIYRGGSTRYVSNLGSVYFQGSEGVRNLVRTFSASVNSSNQKG
jgi:hypothetical protein